jgi:hypothetical protein
LKNLVAPPLHGEVSETCKKKVDTKTDNHITGTKADILTNLAQRSSLGFLVKLNVCMSNVFLTPTKNLCFRACQTAAR